MWLGWTRITLFRWTWRQKLEKVKYRRRRYQKWIRNFRKNWRISQWKCRKLRLSGKGSIDWIKGYRSIAIRKERTRKASLWRVRACQRNPQNTWKSHQKRNMPWIYFKTLFIFDQKRIRPAFKVFLNPWSIHETSHQKHKIWLYFKPSCPNRRFRG